MQFDFYQKLRQHMERVVIKTDFMPAVDLPFSFTD